MYKCKQIGLHGRIPCCLTGRRCSRKTYIVSHEVISVFQLLSNWLNRDQGNICWAESVYLLDQQVGTTVETSSATFALMLTRNHVVWTVFSDTWVLLRATNRLRHYWLYFHIKHSRLQRIRFGLIRWLPCLSKIVITDVWTAFTRLGWVSGSFKASFRVWTW